MTGVGVLLGTAAYMSPEQAKGREADKRSDIWAFGCVLYEMLTGRRAFDGDDMVDVLGAVARLEPNWEALSSDIPRSVRMLIQGCLVKDRRKRVAHISVALFLLDNGPSLAADTTGTVRAAQRRWLSHVATIAATVVAVMFAFAVIRREATAPAPIRRFALDLAGNSVFTANGRHVVAVSVTVCRSGDGAEKNRSANAEAERLTGTAGSTGTTTASAAFFERSIAASALLQTPNIVTASLRWIRGCREIGILIVVFTPLETMFAGRSFRRPPESGEYLRKGGATGGSLSGRRSTAAVRGKAQNRKLSGLRNRQLV
jgi:Protein kinase domain